MSDADQLQAWLTLMTPALMCLLALAVMGVVMIVVDDLRQRQ